MAWVKLDDRYFANGKILKVSPSAVLLHIASMCHCASALNDGEFPLAELGIICAIARVQGPPEVAELVQAGLWDETGQCNAVTGYKVHDFLEYNPPAAKVRADRQRTTARVAKWREAQRNAITGDQCNDVGNGVCNGAPLPLPRPLRDLRSGDQLKEETSAGAELAEDSHPTPEPSLLTFACAGKVKSWSLVESKVKEWREAYPALDVLAECRKALVWVKAHPRRMKTHGGMEGFLIGWLGRTQNNGAPSGIPKKRFDPELFDQLAAGARRKENVSG